jgi:hypothetical protein
MKGNTYDLTEERADQMGAAAEKALRHYRDATVVISVNAAELLALAEAARWAFAHDWGGVEVVLDEHRDREAA